MRLVDANSVTTIHADIVPAVREKREESHTRFVNNDDKKETQDTSLDEPCEQFHHRNKTDTIERWSTSTVVVLFKTTVASSQVESKGGDTIVRAGEISQKVLLR